MDAARLREFAALSSIFLLACAAEPASPPSQLLVSDYRANAIYRYDGVTGAFEGTFAAGAAQRVDRPASVRLGPDDRLYAAGFGRGEVVRYDVRSGAMMDVFYWDTVLLEEPVELLFHGDQLVVLGNDTANLVVIGPDGIATRTFGYPVMRQAHDFVIDDADRVVVATEPAVQVWDLATGTQLGEFGRGELVLATSVAIAEDELLVADWELGQVVAFSLAGESRGVRIAGLDRPISLDLGLDGALYVMDATGIHRFDARTGDHLSQLVARDDRLQWPRSFTFVAD